MRMPWISSLTLTLTFVWVLSARAQTEHVLHIFIPPADGNGPLHGLVFDSSGNLYGTTPYGGLGNGTAFQLTPKENGGWSYRIIHRFMSQVDGVYPSSSLTLDSDGNFYGSTNEGPYNSFGTVYELSRSDSGQWHEKLLYVFRHMSDGDSPQDHLVRDQQGNLYGTTLFGGANNGGVVYKLSPLPGRPSQWTETILHSFGSGMDGAYPHDGLTMDANGNFFGTTAYGGLWNTGTVFELAPDGGGGWTYSVGFDLSAGGPAIAGVIFDRQGNMYGTTTAAVYELSPADGGGWTQSIVYHFARGTDCEAGLVLDSEGNLYGATVKGGPQNAGTVFKLTRNQDGTWTESVLHSFGGRDGSHPFADVVLDEGGNLYGTTIWGGPQNRGVVYKVAP